MERIKMLGLILMLAFFGCEKGPSGPAGPQGPAGPGSTAYTVGFENGVLPDSGYSGCEGHWVDGSSPNTSPGTGAIRVSTGATRSNVSLGLIRFDLSYAIPLNATITAASLQLTTQTTTNLSSGTYVFGAHKIIPPPAGEVPWNTSSTWNVVVAPFGWNGGSSSPITAVADYDATPMASVTVTSAQVNSKQVLLAWSITPSLARVWTNPANNNYGILISPEPETSATLSGFISFWDNTGSSQQKPKMLVEYTVP